jgi:hypothetical protein
MEYMKKSISDLTYIWCYFDLYGWKFEFFKYKYYISTLLYAKIKLSLYGCVIFYLIIHTVTILSQTRERAAYFGSHALSMSYVNAIRKLAY